MGLTAFNRARRLDAERKAAKAVAPAAAPAEAVPVPPKTGAASGAKTSKPKPSKES